MSVWLQANHTQLKQLKTFGKLVRPHLATWLWRDDPSKPKHIHPISINGSEFIHQRATFQKMHRRKHLKNPLLHLEAMKKVPISALFWRPNRSCPEARKPPLLIAEVKAGVDGLASVGRVSPLNYGFKTKPRKCQLNRGRVSVWKTEFTFQLSASVGKVKVP